MFSRSQCTKLNKIVGEKIQDWYRNKKQPFGHFNWWSVIYNSNTYRLDNAPNRNNSYCIVFSRHKNIMLYQLQLKQIVFHHIVNGAYGLDL